MELKIASLEHLDELTQMNIELRCEEGTDTPMSNDAVMRRMQQFISSDEFSVYLLKNDYLIYGYALVNVDAQPAYLRQLFIKEAYRNNGLGENFMTMLMKELAIDRLDVDVMLNNEKAIRFYERLGFRRRYLGLRLTQ